MARPPMKLDLEEGALHKDMGVPEGKGIPTEALEKKKAAAKRSGDVKEERRANFALVARTWHHGGKKGKLSSHEAARSLESRK